MVWSPKVHAMPSGSTSGDASAMVTVRVIDSPTKPNTVLAESVGGTREREREREEREREREIL